MRQLIRKSTFTRWQLVCLRARRPRLLSLLEILEAANVLLARQNCRTWLATCRTALKHGREYCRRQHLAAAYYQQWRRLQERYGSREVARRRQKFRYAPTISFFLVASPDNFPWVTRCLESLSQQWYSRWQAFILAREAEPEKMAPLLRSWRPAADPRIQFATVGGEVDLAATINRTLRDVAGEFVVFLTGRCLLAPAALFEIVQFLNRQPEADVIFGDEDILDPDGRRRDPFFKPGWSPDLALALPYTGQVTVFRTSRVLEAQGARAETLPALEYDILLRLLTQRGELSIHHLPRLLSHQETAADEPGPHAARRQEAGQRALLAYLQRTSQAGTVQPGEFPGTFRLRRNFPEEPGVSIIIPFKDNLPLLSQCLASIFQKTDYPLYEIILVNNQSREKATYDYLAQLTGAGRVRRLDYDRPFNYAAMNNLAAAQARHPFILFLNDDTQVINPGWLRALTEHLQRDEVGAVGGKLLYPDGAIQSGGLALGGGGLLCGDYFRGVSQAEAAQQVLTQVTRNCSAVTGACLLTKKDLFLAAGGFDAGNLPICLNDVDYCLKLRQQGYLIVWTPYAKLFHHESASRGKHRKVADLDRLWREQKFFEEKWAPVILRDPYFNPNLSRLFDGYAY